METANGKVGGDSVRVEKRKGWVGREKNRGGKKQIENVAMRPERDE